MKYNTKIFGSGGKTHRKFELWMEGVKAVAIEERHRQVVHTLLHLLVLGIDKSESFLNPNFKSRLKKRHRGHILFQF